MLIFPNEKQQEIIEQTFACYQYVYNAMLERRKQTKMNLKQSLALLTAMRNEPGNEILTKVDARALRYAVWDLDCDYQKFFQHRSSYPKPRAANNFYCTYNINNAIHCNNLSIRLPKIGFVATEDFIKEEIKKVVIVRRDGQYHIFFINPNSALNKEERS